MLWASEATVILRALSTGDDSALEGLSYLEDLDVADAADAVEESLETPLPFHETEAIETAHELGDQDGNTSIPVNTQTGIQENKITNIQEYPQTSLPENTQTGIPVNLPTGIEPDVEPGNQEFKNTSNIAVWPDHPIRGRRGSLEPLPGKIHWERRSNRTYRIDAETHDLVGDAATVVQRRAGYKLTRDDIAEWALRYAAKDILARGMMSDILRDLLSPGGGSASGDDTLQFADPGDDPTGIQENKNTGNPVNMNTRLPYVDSINHPSLLSSLTERDESSRIGKTSLQVFQQDCLTPWSLSSGRSLFRTFRWKSRGTRPSSAPQLISSHRYDGRSGCLSRSSPQPCTRLRSDLG